MTTDANSTMVKFGYPDTLVAQYASWSVQLRPKQVTLGALVAICRAPATAFHRIGAAAFAELEKVSADIDAALTRFVAHERINYLMLMMVDPDVHFHVLPRYSTARTFAGLHFTDAGWPGPPDLKSGVETDAATRGALVARLHEVWPR
jgi:diadenosine tetraphosphate (Ap4A) HIT family hydrolase